MFIQYNRWQIVSSIRLCYPTSSGSRWRLFFCFKVFFFFFFFKLNLQHYNIVHWDFRNAKSFVFKDKLVCTMKERMVDMATINIILEHGVYLQNSSCLHYYLPLNLDSVERYDITLLSYDK